MVESASHGLAEETDTTWRFAISGASGLLGSHLSDYLQMRGHEVVPLVRDRHETGPDSIYWNIDDREIETEALEGFDAVVHLAAENLFGRWTQTKKESIRTSRIEGTTLLSEALAELDRPPEVFLSASAVGYYGHTGDQWVDESDGAGEGFLAELCEEWEACTEPAAEAGIRTVCTRNAVVMSEKGGALAMMLPIFRMGLGGRVGSGDQFMSWMAIDDFVRATEFIARYADLEGGVNVTAPNPVRNEELTEKLGEILGRPTFLPVPAFGARLVFGELADEALLGGQRVRPTKLREAGFEWEFPHIEGALRAALDEPD